MAIYTTLKKRDFQRGNAPLLTFAHLFSKYDYKLYNPRYYE